MPLLGSRALVPEKNSTRFPSGRKRGLRCVVFSLVVVVIGAAAPPAAETIERPPFGWGAKTIPPLAPQLAPLPSSASQIVCTAPPAAGTFFSLRSAKNPR